jgi:hypothetical protein
MRMPVMQACKKTCPAISRAQGQARQGLGLRQRLHALQDAAHLLAAGVGAVQGVGGFLHLLAHLGHPFAIAVELGFDRAEHLPHLGGLFLQGQGAKAHVQAVQNRQQGGGAGQRDAVVALQAVHQAGAAQHLGIQALDRQKQNRKVGGVGWCQVAFGDALGLLANA